MRPRPGCGAVAASYSRGGSPTPAPPPYVLTVCTVMMMTMYNVVNKPHRHDAPQTGVWRGGCLVQPGVHRAPVGVPLLAHGLKEGKADEPHKEMKKRGRIYCHVTAQVLDWYIYCHRC